MAHHEPSYQDLHCLPFWFDFLLRPRSDQIQSGEFTLETQDGRIKFCFDYTEDDDGDATVRRPKNLEMKDMDGAPDASREPMRPSIENRKPAPLPLQAKEEDEELYEAPVRNSFFFFFFFFFWCCRRRDCVNGAPACVNVSSGIWGQQRPRSACTSAQSDQGLPCPLTELLDTAECMNWRAKTRMIFCAEWSESEHFALMFESIISLDVA